jgi:hypothetical protein
VSAKPGPFQTVGWLLEVSMQKVELMQRDPSYLGRGFVALARRLWLLRADDRLGSRPGLLLFAKLV